MEKTTLFDIIDGALFYKWREEIEKTEINKTLGLMPTNCGNSRTAH